MEIQKGFKQTEVGLIPNDWEVKPLEKEIDLLTGYPFSSNQYSKDGIKLLRGSNVKRGVTDWTEENTKYWQSVTFGLNEYALNDGDIVIAMDGSLVGRSFARLSKDDLPALLLQRVARVRSNNIDMGYLKEFICSDYFTKYLDTVKTASAIPHISPKDIRNFKIPLPPTKAEQTAIATALNDTDRLISRLEKLIAKKSNMKQGAMQELLKPKDGWEVKKLGEIAEMYSGGTPNTSVAAYYQGKIPWVVIADMTKAGKYINETEKKISDDGVNNSSAKLFNKGTLLFAMYASIGKCSIAKIDLTCNQAILGIKPTKIDTEFLYYFLFMNEEKFGTIGQTGTQKNLNKGMVQAISIPYPKIKEQQVIAQILSEMDAEIESLEKKLEKYKMIKQGMMQNLLTGKIRLV